MITIPPTEAISCPVITTLLEKGRDNDSKEVAGLQSVLKNTEKLEVDATGIFDDKTEAAIKVFQKKYADVILAPWDATRATGIVSLTTAKKLNQIACGVPLTMNEKELAQIADYKAKSVAEKAAHSTGAALTPGLPSEASNDDAPTGQSAAALNAVGGSVIHRFGAFLANLFK